MIIITIQGVFRMSRISPQNPYQHIVKSTIFDQYENIVWIRTGSRIFQKKNSQNWYFVVSFCRRQFDNEKLRNLKIITKTNVDFDNWQFDNSRWPHFSHEEAECFPRNVVIFIQNWLISDSLALCRCATHGQYRQREKKEPERCTYHFCWKVGFCVTGTKLNSVCIIVADAVQFVPVIEEFVFMRA